LRTNIRLVLTLFIGAGLAGCGSGSRSGADGVASLPDGAAAGAETAAPADAGSAIEIEASANHPTGGVEAGLEATAPRADVGVDVAAVPPDVASATDILPTTPDAVAVAGMDATEAVARTDAAEAPSRPDAVETAKPADAMAFDAAKPATDLPSATLGEMSPQQLHDALDNKDFLLIDVHYPNAGSIPGTDARIAFDDIPALVAFIGPNLDTKVVLTCLMGGMSKSAGNALVARGYRNISELTGGMTAWTQANYPLVHLDGGM
jgi:phage shock protein E